MPDICRNTIFFFNSLEKSTEKNAEKRVKKLFKIFHFSHPYGRSVFLEIIKSDLFKYLKIFLGTFKKKIGAEILINTKVIKVLLTGGVNPI